jgi:hypothetical protein
MEDTMTYAEKLKDPRWQKKRLEVLEARKWACEICFSEERTLHVHHDKYKGDPWDADIGDIYVLCEMCHDLVHRMKKFIKKCNTVDLLFFMSIASKETEEKTLMPIELFVLFIRAYKEFLTVKEGKTFEQTT